MLTYLYVYLLGILSILGACTIIVIPVLLSQVISNQRKLYTAIVFSLGFSSSFAILGTITGFVGRTIVPRYEPYFLLLSATITFIMALRFFKFISFNIPAIPIRFMPENTFFLGFVFGFIAWSCMSALLSAVFVLAMAKKSVIGSMLTFLAYSFGYCTPLIAASTIIEESEILSFITKNRKEVDILSGSLLLFASAYLILIYFGMAPI